MKNEDTKSYALSAFRMPDELREKAKAKAKESDLTFSQLMRRALRRELAGMKQSQTKSA